MQSGLKRVVLVISYEVGYDPVSPYGPYYSPYDYYCNNHGLFDCFLFIRLSHTLQSHSKQSYHRCTASLPLKLTTARQDY